MPCGACLDYLRLSNLPQAGVHLDGEATDELAGVHVVYVKVVAAPPAHAPSPFLLVVEVCRGDGAGPGEAAQPRLHTSS